MNIEDFMVQDITLPTHKPKVPAQERAHSSATLKRRFLRGPVNAEWIEAAARLSGRALHVAIVCIYLDGFEKTGTVRLKPSARDRFGMDRFAVGRGLKQLGEAGLVSFESKRGKAPVVTLIGHRPPPR
jgi:hypothetical protein